MSMESLYEYGSRAGVWRLLALFKRFNVPVTIFAVADALKRYPDMAEVFLKHGHEIASHGLKWINYQDVDEATERAHIAEAVEIIAKLTGEEPLGWYTGRTSPNTRRLVIEHGGFLYDADDYNDDLPYWNRQFGRAPSGGAVRSRRQRHAFRHPAGLQHQRTLSHLPARHIRRALC